jgi:phosphate-selective porin
VVFTTQAFNQKIVKMTIKKSFSTIVLTLSVAFMSMNLANAQGCMEASSDEGVSIKGYIQPQWEYYQTTDGKDANSFTFNRARIAALGNIPYDVSYFVMMDLSKFKGGPELIDAFVTYNRFDWAKITFGQFKSPLSLEQNTACQGLHTIYRSKAVDELAGPQRDIGAMIFGGKADSKFHYYLAVMNDYARGFEDENNGKSLKGRLTYSPLDFLQIGGSFAYGETGVESDNEKTRLGGELQLTFGNFLFQSEYLWADDTGNYTTGGGCDGTPIEFHTGGVTRNGYYAQAMYMTSWNLQPVVKLESFDSNVDINDNSETILTFGVNYFLNEWTRIQANYRYKAEQLLEIPNDQFVLQVQVKF